MLPNCFLPPLIPHFQHHDDLVLVLDPSWTQLNLLQNVATSNFQQKQINSLILQLYSILEKCEASAYNQLPEDTFESTIICSSAEDILLIVPTIVNDSNMIPIHQFLSQVLAKLLPLSLMPSVAHIICQESVPISHAKSILQMIAFQVPIEEISEEQLKFWFDVNRGNFLHQYLSSDCHLSQLEHIYLQFLCNCDAKTILDAITVMQIDSNNCIRL